MVPESQASVWPRPADYDPEDERVSVWLAVFVLIALSAVFIIGGLIIKQTFFYTPTPRSALEREMASYRQQIRRNPEDALARINLARVLYRLGQTPAALSQLKTAQDIDESLWEAPFQIGLIYMRQKDVDQAIKYFSLAKKADPANELAYHQLGAVYLEQKKYDLAIKNLQEAVRLRPIVANAHYSLGSAYEAKGEAARAVEHYNEALKYIPDMAEAKEALKRLSKSQQAAP